MKRIILGFGAGLIAVCVVVLGVVAMQPDQISAERTIKIGARSADVEALVFDLRDMNRWSPWVELDPELVQTYSDETDRVGSFYAWEGNDQVGKGRMTIANTQPGEVVHTVDFVEPFPGKIRSVVSWSEVDDQVEVSWKFTQNADFMLKGMNLLMGIEEMVAADYAHGLARLKPLVEERAQWRILEEKKKAELMKLLAEEAAKAAAAAAQE